MFSTHDPDQARELATRVAVISNGGLAAYGTPDETLTASVLSAVYGVPIVIERTDSGRSVVAFARPLGGRQCLRQGDTLAADVGDGRRLPEHPADDRPDGEKASRCSASAVDHPVVIVDIESETKWPRTHISAGKSTPEADRRCGCSRAPAPSN